ncbi:PhoPQ-activated pathogenicity-related family protein [Cupriavidus necator]
MKINAGKRLTTHNTRSSRAKDKYSFDFVMSVCHKSSILSAPFPQMKRLLLATVLTLFVTACSWADSEELKDPCADSPGVDFTHVLPCYRQLVESEPLRYAMSESTPTPGIEKRTFRMTSQSWSPERLVQPTEWLHEVTLYIPDHALRQRALVIVNNGSRYSLEGATRTLATDFPAQTLADIAQATKTVVVSVEDVPNQALVYADDGKARTEDASVAHSWSLFMTAPHARPTMSLHIPMAATVSRALTLAQRELASLGIHRFIVSGISKRAWSSWLATIADPRIDAVVPFAMDLLDTRAALKHIFQSYGGNWPLAFRPYYTEAIDRRIDTQPFSWLMQIEDPLAYLGTQYGARLAVPKYIVNASGDEFFVPDNSKFYYDRLPGEKALRMVPNSSHGGIRNSATEVLTSFVNRFQQSMPLPVVQAELRNPKSGPSIVGRSSEVPQKLLLWRATNPSARDFRHACGIRFVSTPVQTTDPQTFDVPLEFPASGWSAQFVEATFADGLVATSQVYVVGKQEYPSAAPATDGATCQTLPGRDLATGQLTNVRPQS